MTGYPGLVTQAAIRAALVANAGVTAIIGQRMYDRVPPSAEHPLARFGRFMIDRDDTMGERGWRVAVEIVVENDKPAGRVEAMQAAEAIFAVLHRQPAAIDIAGYDVIDCLVESQVVMPVRRDANIYYEASINVEVVITEG